MGWISPRAHTLRPAFAALAVAAAAVSFLFAVPSADARSSRGEPPRVELPTRFAQCPQFFANGQPPQVPNQPALRELCYEAFAVLHSGSTRTPVYVAKPIATGSATCETLAGLSVGDVRDNLEKST